jgi:hypothetical protein
MTWHRQSVGDQDRALHIDGAGVPGDPLGALGGLELITPPYPAHHPVGPAELDGQPDAQPGAVAL